MSDISYSVSYSGTVSSTTLYVISFLSSSYFGKLLNTYFHSLLASIVAVSTGSFSLFLYNSTVIFSGLFPSWLSLSCQFLFTFIVTSGFTGISSSSSTVVFPSVAVAMFIMSFDIVSFCSVSKTALMSSCFTTYPTFNVACFPASNVSIFANSSFAFTVWPSKITSNESVTTTLVAL